MTAVSPSLETRAWQPLPGLHVTAWGPPERQGAPVILIHGSFTPYPDAVWAAQRELAAEREVLVLHRRGYGRSPLVPRKNLDRDAADILELCRGVGGHLVGHGYGAIAALYFAVLRPDRVRSLVAVEPPAFQAAPAQPDAQALRASLAAAYARRPELTPEEFAAAVGPALGKAVPGPEELTADWRQSLLATLVEPAPWDVPLNLEAVRACGCAKYVITGGWQAGYEAVADALAEQLAAERAVLPGAGHQVPSLGEPFNWILRPLLAA